jgi:hypothetical protein
VTSRLGTGKSLTFFTVYLYNVNTNFEDLEERGGARLSEVKEGGGAPVSPTIPHLSEKNRQTQLFRNRKRQVADLEAPSFGDPIYFF